MEEERREGDHEDHAELINGGKLGGQPELQGSEVADPGEAGG